MADSVSIRAMTAQDFDEADRVRRLAFGTYFQVPEPMQFGGDRSLQSRWNAYPGGGVVAVSGDRIVGMAFASELGSFGMLGPVAVLPEFWRQGVARQLMAAVVAIIDRWQCRLAGLFTFPQSAQHIRLYQQFGFWPRHLTPVMAKPVAAKAEIAGTMRVSGDADRTVLMARCGALAGAIFPGLDLGREMEAVADGKQGDVIVLTEGSSVAAFAICHCGPGSEGGSAHCYVKFAFARPGTTGSDRLERLIQACESYAAARGAQSMSAGTSTGRHFAYRLLVGMGFRTQLTGIQMHRPWIEAYDRADVFALDDWR
ncbi:MAG TPA: GNAT family N-acetyltransferase [Stellaceae bacterium]|nr:GNAT family N-acetyltransferase [Stellaceae bacterium]